MNDKSAALDSLSRLIKMLGQYEKVLSEIRKNFNVEAGIRHVKQMKGELTAYRNCLVWGEEKEGEGSFESELIQAELGQTKFWEFIQQLKETDSMAQSQICSSKILLSKFKEDYVSISKNKESRDA